MDESDPDFRRARGKLEAVTRIAALTGSPPETLGPGSKERKSVLVNLAGGLGLQVDVLAPKPELGAQIATALDAPWDKSCWSTGQTITLDGLNSVLLAAERWLARQRAAQEPLFEPLQPAPAEFVPAESKLEAVTRIAALTGSPPETLGPGSKERKSVLVNLAGGLGLQVDVLAPKPELGAQIATALDAPWDESCWSTGQTITLDGLNALLRAAESRLVPPGSHAPGIFFSAVEEARALLSTLSTALPTALDGRSCILEMEAAGYSQWAQDEWVAFYFEFAGLPALINAFGGGPRTFANTRFDYGLGHTWDLKAHMAHSGVAPLNDRSAVDAALAAGAGVGFLVLTGDVEYDDGAFRQWQREFRASKGKVARPRAMPAKYRRRSKRAFRPTMLEAFYLRDAASLTDAVKTGSISVMSQGAQASGRARRPKYAIDLVKARWGGLLVSQLVLDGT
jgi:hypothetical protein